MKKRKKFKINIENMGVNIDKNEYREIVLSNSARPEIIKNVKNFLCTKNYERYNRILGLSAPEFDK